MERKDVAENLKWKLTDIFPDDDAWEAEFKAIDEEYSNFDFAQYKGKLQNKADLLAYFTMSDTLSRRIEKLYLYAHMRHDEDVRISKYTSANARVSMLISRLFAQMSYVDPELTALDDSVLQSFIEDPDFAAYEYSLRKVAKSKAHVLSEGEEKLLALSGDVMRDFQSIFSMLNNANLNLPTAKLNDQEVPMSHGLYGVALHTGTAEERKEWFEKYYGAFIKLIDTIAQTYASNVKKNVF